MALSPTAKLLWFYLLDHCDNAGVVELNTKLASFQIGEPIEPQNLTELGDRLQTLPNGKLWIPKFIRFQNGVLTSGSRVHLSIIKLIQSHALDYPIPLVSHVNGIAKGCQSLKVQVQVKNKVQKEGVQGENEVAKELIEVWNQTGLPKCMELSGKRKKSLSCRLSEKFFTDNWRAAIAKISASEFCQGKNDRGWKADFDWFISPDAVVKTMEGKYDHRETFKKPGDPGYDWRKDPDHKPW